MKKAKAGGCAYKKGGKIKAAKKEVKAEGSKTRPRLDKFTRGGAAKKNHKTQVNVIVGGGQKQPMPVPVPVGGTPPGAPPMAPPMGAPMMAPKPGMKRGGKVKQTHGAGGGLGRLDKAQNAKNTD